MAGPIHYELYVRKTAPAPWGLQMATEDRSQAIQQAETLLADGDVVAVRVTKETLDPDTMEFQSVTVLTKGAPEVKKKKLIRDDGQQSNCLSPADVYAPHARDLIGRVLEDWLVRQGVTVFELLHRADLAELLDASGVELQHAIQKISVPESQDTGQSVHDLVRHYQKLAEATIARIITTERKGRFPDLNKTDLARTAEKLAGESDRAFLMGGAIARRLCEVRGPRARLNALMDMAEAAPPAGPAKALVYIVLDQILAEMATQRAAMADILGPSLDPGAMMAATVAMLAPDETALVVQASPAVAQDLPVIEGAAKRLAERLGNGLLKPRDAAGEIEVLRVLATLLTATGDTLLTTEEVQTAFVERSKSLVTADFVGQYTSCFEGVAAEADALLRLCENVTGASSKRAAARWFLASITSLKFESDLLSPACRRRTRTTSPRRWVSSPPLSRQGPG